MVRTKPLEVYCSRKRTFQLPNPVSPEGFTCSLPRSRHFSAGNKRRGARQNLSAHGSSLERILAIFILPIDYHRLLYLGLTIQTESMGATNRKVSRQGTSTCTLSYCTYNSVANRLCSSRWGRNRRKRREIGREPCLEIKENGKTEVNKQRQRRKDQSQYRGCATEEVPETCCRSH